MNNVIQTNYGTGTYGLFPRTRTAARTGCFLDIAAKLGQSAAEVSKKTEVSAVDAYMNHLKNKYGRVTIESIGKDRQSLEKAGRRMTGYDVIIAPNILEDMAHDVKTAAYYEQKIDDGVLIPGTGRR